MFTVYSYFRNTVANMGVYYNNRSEDLPNGKNSHLGHGGYTMDKELVKKWENDKKKYIMDCITKMQEMIEENDYCGVKCYASFIEQAAIEAATYEHFSEMFW